MKLLNESNTCIDCSDTHIYKCIHCLRFVCDVHKCKCNECIENILCGDCCHTYTY